MLYSLARPLLFSLDPETAHEVTLRLARFSPRLQPFAAPVRAMGIDFANPVGLAAGLDKHAEHVRTLATMGFGFLELGGVTPRPQIGNPRPRLFRLPEARAIINRLGLNSIGVDAFAENLRQARAKGAPGAAVIGVNIAKNRDTPNERAVEDYERCMQALYPLADYLSVNVSSPNTRGLRALQSAELLSSILKALVVRRERLRERHGRNVALVLKISPDIDEAAIRDIAEVARRERVDGLIATNTTVARDGVMGLAHGAEDGGLSGEPLRERACAVLARFHAHLKGEVTLIGGGGIMSGADARARFRAGAALVQIYSGLVYRGPRLIRECISAYEARQGSAH
jgi:dihydroorotate dehydrogenase